MIFANEIAGLFNKQFLQKNMVNDVGFRQGMYIQEWEKLRRRANVYFGKWVLGAILLKKGAKSATKKCQERVEITQKSAKIYIVFDKRTL